MAQHSDALPPITHVLETCLYVRRKADSVRFYRDILGLEPFFDQPRTTGFALGSTILLLFQLGATAEDQEINAQGVIPGHGPSKAILDLLHAPEPPSSSDAAPSNLLKQHFCLGVQDRGHVAQYESRLREKNVKITGTMDWELGGRSVYFEDPDGHVGEIGSRGIWPSY